jgi:hypothetical protein
MKNGFGCVSKQFRELRSNRFQGLNFRLMTLGSGARLRDDVQG